MPKGTVVDGKYTVQQVLGEGGMGVVYLANAIHTGTGVVLKAIRSELAHRADVRERTLAEGRALAQIDHPNVVQLKAVVAEEQDLWLVMQYVEGESLEDTLQRYHFSQQRMPLDEALRIFRQALAGVEAAHREGLIHRDLKPGNILIRKKDGVVKVTDFGIAKVEEDALAGKGKTQGFIGSPYYACREQIVGQRDLDRRVDIYALGVMLYEMLAGELPFDSSNTFELMRMHAEAPVPSLTAKRPEVPAGLDEIIRKACAKDREGRFDSCEQMLQAIDEATGVTPAPPLTHTPTPGPLATPPEPTTALPVEQRPLGTITGQAASLPATVRDRRRSWVWPLVILVLVGGTGGALVYTGVIPLEFGGEKPKSERTATGTSTTKLTTTVTDTSSVPSGSPLDRLVGRWEAKSKRKFDAVRAGDTVEFRVVDPKQFEPQEYRAAEARFVLSPLPGKADTFAVEDRVRPEPPLRMYAHKQVRLKFATNAFNTCLAVITEVDGRPLRATLNGDQLAVQFAIIKPHPERNFLIANNTVQSCHGLNELAKGVVKNAFTRQ